MPAADADSLVPDQLLALSAMIVAFDDYDDSPSLMVKPSSTSVSDDFHGLMVISSSLKFCVHSV